MRRRGNARTSLTLRCDGRTQDKSYLLLHVLYLRLCLRINRSVLPIRERYWLFLDSFISYFPQCDSSEALLLFLTARSDGPSFLTIMANFSVHAAFYCLSGNFCCCSTTLCSPFARLSAHIQSLNAAILHSLNAVIIHLLFRSAFIP